MAVDAISYAVSVASLLASASARQRRDPQAAGAGLRAEIAEGLSFVFRHPILRKIVACTGTANLFGSMGIALEIVFLIRVLRVRPADTGLLIAVASLGGVAGGLLSGRLGRRIGSARIIWFSMLVIGFPQLLIPLAAPGWRVAAFAVGMAFFSFSAVVYNVGAGQLPAGDLPAPAARPDERRRSAGWSGARCRSAPCSAACSAP